MRLGAIQSCYIPWRGYFDFIASVDVFVVADDLAYSRHGFRNRNRIRARDGSRWLTVPVHAHGSPPISEVAIAEPFEKWTNAHLCRLREAYAGSVDGRRAIDIWRDGLPPGCGTLSGINDALLKRLCDVLDIRTRIVSSADLAPAGVRTRRILDMMRIVGADTYLTGPSALSYLELEAFRERRLGVEVKSYVYPEYDQKGAGFDPHVSIMDVVANLGIDRAREMIRSQAPNQRLV